MFELIFFITGIDVFILIESAVVLVYYVDQYWQIIQNAYLFDKKIQSGIIVILCNGKINKIQIKIKLKIPCWSIKHVYLV